MKKITLVILSVVVTASALGAYYVFGSASVTYLPSPRWLFPYGSSDIAVSNGVTITSGKVLLSYLAIPVGGQINEICNISGGTITGAQSMRLGIYGPVTTSLDDPTGAPLLVSTASSSLAAANTRNCIAVATTTAPAGSYYAAFHSNGANVDVANNGAPGANAFPTPLFRTFSQTYGAFPATLPATTVANAGSGGDGTVWMAIKMVSFNQ